MPTTQKRAAIFCRVSTPGQAEDEKSSLATQERECRRRADEDGLLVVEEHVACIAHTASDPDDRPELERLLRAAMQGKFHVVLMDVIDRTTRSGVFDFADICNRFLRAGVTPVWARDRSIDLTTEMGRLLATIKAFSANQERESLVRRFRDGKQGRIARGLLGRAYLPYGYAWNADHTDYVPDRLTAPVVQRVYATLAQGGSAARLRDALNREQVASPAQRKGLRRRHLKFQDTPPLWSVAMICDLVRNPVYKGERVQNRYMRVERDPHERRERGLKSKYQVIERPEADWHITPVTPLVDAATWDQAVQQLTRNAFATTKQATRFTTDEVLCYGGLVRCALCGRAMTVRRRANCAGWEYYCMANKPTPTGARCPSASIAARILDPLVWEQAVRVIQDPDYLRACLHDEEDVWSPAQQVEHYTHLIAECDAKDRALASELLRCADTPALAHIRAIFEQDAILNATLREGYQQKLAAAEFERDRRDTELARVTSFAAWAQAHRDNLADLTSDERREILRHTMHPTIFIGRRDRTPDVPRVDIIFCVTQDAAAHLTPNLLHRTTQWQDAKGDLFVVTVATDDPAPRAFAAGETLDLSEVVAAQDDPMDIATTMSSRP